MTRAELIKQVALRMDEVSPDITIANLSVDGSDNNPLYTLIDGLIDGGLLELFSVAQYWRLPQKAFTYSSTASANQIIVEVLPNALADRTSPGNGDAELVSPRKMIRLKVPDDFLRVAEINCTDFLRPITEVVTEISEAGKRQHNRALMGKEARPVGVMSHGVWNSSQAREIDCYSLSSGSTVSASNNSIVASYIAKPETISDTASPAVSVETALGGSSVLVPALEWLIAARTFGARGDANHAAICQQNAQNVLV